MSVSRRTLIARVRSIKYPSRRLKKCPSEQTLGQGDAFIGWSDHGMFLGAVRLIIDSDGNVATSTFVLNQLIVFLPPRGRPVTGINGVAGVNGGGYSQARDHADGFF